MSRTVDSFPQLQRVVSDRLSFSSRGGLDKAFWLADSRARSASEKPRYSLGSYVDLCPARGCWGRVLYPLDRSRMLGVLS